MKLLLEGFVLLFIGGQPAVVDRGRPAPRYEQWPARVLIDALLPRESAQA